jgi:hypothetical protein
LVVRLKPIILQYVKYMCTRERNRKNGCTLYTCGSPPGVYGKDILLWCSAVAESIGVGRSDMIVLTGFCCVSLFRRNSTLPVALDTGLVVQRSNIRCWILVVQRSNTSCRYLLCGFFFETCVDCSDVSFFSVRSIRKLLQMDT